MKNSNNPIGWIFFLTIIGAAVYYIHQANSFWGDVGGLLKALVWPAFVIYQVLQRLKF